MVKEVSLLHPQPDLLPAGIVNLCTEGTQKICYGVNGGISQGFEPEMIEYVAMYLRLIGQSNTGLAARWTMPASPGLDCQEWGLPVPEATGVLALAKHVKPAIHSPVLYEDLATTIDGGEGATEEQHKAALLGCGGNGGQRRVVVDPANPAYATEEYKNSKARPEGIIIKLVKAP